MKEHRIIDGQLVETEIVTETRTAIYDIAFLLKQADTLKAELATVDALIEKAQALMKATAPITPVPDVIIIP